MNKTDRIQAEELRMRADMRLQTRRERNGILVPADAVRTYTAEQADVADQISTSQEGQPALGQFDQETLSRVQASFERYTHQSPRYRK